MNKKTKGETIDFLYTSKNELNKKTKGSSKKSNQGRQKRTNNNENNTRINLDNEIIIGLTPKNINNNTKTSKKKVQKKDTKVKTKKSKTNSHTKETKKTKQISKAKSRKNKKQSKKKKIVLKIVKWTSILAVIITAVILFMMSSIFNISQIVVTNNNKISSQEIISLSNLQIGTNIFKTTNKIIRDGVKNNPYIENVKVKRNLNGVITLEVEERTPTYMLKFANAYVYINNQGYMLEITEELLELPVIIGFETPAEEISEGNRLVVEDLKKLEDVIKIIDSSKNNSLANMITEIDISDSTNYILTIASESKKVQFGDISNVNIKLLKIEALIEQEKGVAGEIYFQGIDRTIFREEVKR